MATGNDNTEHEDGYDSDGFASGDERPTSANREPTTARINFAERTGKPASKRDRDRAQKQTGSAKAQGEQPKTPPETVKKPSGKKGGGRKATKEEAEQAADAFLAMFDGATTLMLNRPDAALTGEEVGVIRDRMVRVFQRMNPVATSKYQAITDPLMIGVGFFFWYQRMATTAPVVMHQEPPYQQPIQEQQANVNGSDSPTGSGHSIFAGSPPPIGS